MHIVAGKIFKKRFGKRALSPVISTVILTGAIVALLSVTLIFANGILWSKIAESDFNSARQFMQTVGLTIDDVAWEVGRTETIRYSSRDGEVTIESLTLNYTVYVETDGNGTHQFSYETGVLLFNVPVSKYSLTNGYWEPIFPSQSDTLTLKGTSAPVTRVFAVQKSPMYDGSYIRVVVAPSIRFMNSTITTSGSTYYAKLYLPVLTLGSAPRRSQAVTLSGNSRKAHTISGVTKINVTVSFTKEDFDNSFFNFPHTSEEIAIPPGYNDAVFEFYVGGVTVDFGIE
jgi:hypothetical protein